jgi:hypothetical protein
VVLQLSSQMDRRIPAKIDIHPELPVGTAEGIHSTVAQIYWNQPGLVACDLAFNCRSGQYKSRSAERERRYSCKVIPSISTIVHSEFATAVVFKYLKPAFWDLVQHNICSRISTYRTFFECTISEVSPFRRHNCEAHHVTRFTLQRFMSVRSGIYPIQ